MLRIAIDGPGGAGKSTISKLVAKEFGIDYVDTGAMYRAIALKLSRAGVNPGNEALVEEIVQGTNLDFEGANILLDGEDVSSLIRTQDVSMMASNASKLACVRSLVSGLSMEMARTRDLVMDGRDIGTNVIKDAELKIFLTASPEVRAKRRYEELLEAKKDADYERILAEIQARDYQDMHRELNPLVQADDAILLDTSDMNIEEVVEAISEQVEKVKRG